MSINKNVTYPKELKCPTCHVVSDSDVEYWMQDYDFPSWFVEQCNNPKCENYDLDFKVNLRVVVKVAEDWIPVTDRLPPVKQDCWAVTKARQVDIYHLTPHNQHFGRWWVGSDGHVLRLDVITHWQPLERPEAPGE